MPENRCRKIDDFFFKCQEQEDAEDGKLSDIKLIREDTRASLLCLDCTGHLDLNFIYQSKTPEHLTTISERLWSAYVHFVLCKKIINPLSLDMRNIFMLEVLREILHDFSPTVSHL